MHRTIRRYCAAAGPDWLTQTHRHTDRHTDTTHSALSRSRKGYDSCGDLGRVRFAFSLGDALVAGTRFPLLRTGEAGEA